MPKSIQDVIPGVVHELSRRNTSPFIEANTLASDLNDIKNNHIIPVFIKDNEPVIGHAEFIDTTMDVLSSIYKNSSIEHPQIRLSHPIMGRVPEAKNKPAAQLLDSEKTMYYERMAFAIEIPSISITVDGNCLNLTIGGVKAYNLDNLNNKHGANQHFKLFIGFQNKVCTNMCIATDGLLSSVKVKTLEQLKNSIYSLVNNYDSFNLGKRLRSFEEYELKEAQFVHLVGRCKLYKFLPEHLKKDIPELLFGDGQINTLCKEYYHNSDFGKYADGGINLWRLYNLFTGANKSTYIDNFLERGLNAFELTKELQGALHNRTDCWYLN